MVFTSLEDEMIENENENEESLFLQLFDSNIIENIFIQIATIQTIGEDIKSCYLDCKSFSLTSKLFNTISKQTKFSIHIFQKEEIQNINYPIYSKLKHILQLQPFFCKSKEEILNQILIYVAKDGMYHLIENLLLNGANIDYIDPLTSYSPLLYSCENGLYKTSKTLILNGANINCKTNDEITLMHLASIAGNLKLVKLLVKKGLDVNSLNFSSENALFDACYYGNTDIVKYLIENGCNYNIQNNFSENLLFDSCNSGNIDLVKYLINEKRLNINQIGSFNRTILFSAIQSRNTELIDYLLSLGFDINFKDRNGHTPLYFAARNIKSLVVVKHLISKGADLNIKFDGRNLLEIMKSESGKKAGKEVIEELKKYF